MEENKNSPGVKNELSGSEELNFTSQQILAYECEREILILERDIRQQKESSVNAKTAITFEQLRKIHSLGKLLGPQKEVFFDRICRAADIQRASLKNRLKQNKEKFEPPTLSPYRHSYPEVGTPSDGTPSVYSSPWHQFGNFSTPNENPRTPSSSVTDFTPLFRSTSAGEDDMKLPAERSFDLMQLGFSFDEVKQIADLFDQYRDIIKPHSPGLTIDQLLNQFANLISLSVPENLKLLSYSFNLLEMGYSRQEVARLIARERRKQLLEPYDIDLKPKRSRPSSAAESSSEAFPSQNDQNGNQSDDEVPFT